MKIRKYLGRMSVEEGKIYGMQQNALKETMSIRCWSF